MTMHEFDKLTKRDFENGAVLNEIRDIIKNHELTSQYLKNAKKALEILKRYNRISNDLQAYLFHVAEWGLGEEGEPDPQDYGVTE